MTDNEKLIIKTALSILDTKLKSTSVQFLSPDNVRDFLRLQLQGKEREYFGVMFLNTQNQLIEFEILHSGSISSTEVHPREILKATLRHNASALILVHNHPSGDPTPSKADVSITAKIKNALSYIDTRLLDHLIVGGCEITSMANLGHI